MGRAMLSKSVIQFSVVGRGCVPSLLFDLRPNYGGGHEDNGDLLQKVPCTHCCTHCTPTQQQATTDSCLHQRLLDILGQVWVSLLWGHCFFLLGPGALQESVSPVLCKFWPFYGEFMAVSSMRAYVISRFATPRAPSPAAGHC